MNKNGGTEAFKTATVVSPNVSYRFNSDDLVKYDYTLDENGRVTGVRLNEYSIEEVVPAGYYVSYPEGVTVQDGKVIVAVNEAQNTYTGYDLKNTPTKLHVSKLDATNKAELAGAELTLTRVSTKEIAAHWWSTTDPYYVEGLIPGEEYTLTELTAPAGYKKADPVTFTMNADGVVQTVAMEDERIFGDVTLTKQDYDTRTNISGAAFNLVKQGGGTVRVSEVSSSAGEYEYTENTTGTTTTTLTVSETGTLTVRNLPYGTYYFEEIKAPAGYELTDMTREQRTFSISNAETKPALTNVGNKAAAVCFAIPLPILPFSGSAGMSFP